MKDERKKMPFHFVLTDNETGEVIHDIDICAIIGGFAAEGGRSCTMALTKCNIFSFASAMRDAEEAVETMKANHPELALLMQIAKMREIEDAETTEE